MLDRLSPRQRRVLVLFVMGLSEKQTAARLGISIHTVHSHAKEIHRRLGVASHGEIISVLIAQGALRLTGSLARLPENLACPFCGVLAGSK